MTNKTNKPTIYVTPMGSQYVNATELVNSVAGQKATQELREAGLVKHAKANEATVPYEIFLKWYEAVSRNAAVGDGFIAGYEAAERHFQMKLEEREAACCPEDIGFEEYIRALEAKLAALNAGEKDR